MNSRTERLRQIEAHLIEKFNLPPGQIEEMLPNFIVALAAHLENIEQAVEAGDLNAIGRAGHTMKGALLNLGLNDCVEVALEIEQRGKAKDSAADFHAMSVLLRSQLGELLQ